MRIVAVAALAVLLLACGGDDSVEPLVAPAEAQELLADDDVTLIDVRTPEEFDAGHLDGAVLLDYESPDFEKAIADLPRDEHYVIYCQTGNRSAGAAALMADLGFDDVTEIDGGFEAWVADGQPVTTD